MNNKVKIAIISTMVVGLSAVSVAPALAANHPDGKVGFFEKVALMMGFKKDLPADKRAQHIDQMRQKHADKQAAKLDALVSSGKITEAQKTELKAKIDAIEAVKEANAGKSREEIKAATKSAREDLKAWAQANNLNMSDLMPNRHSR